MHDVLSMLMGTSKQLITALEKSDWLDRLLIVAALAFFVLVVLFILKQRILDRGLRVAFWWTRFLPSGGGGGGSKAASGIGIADMAEKGSTGVVSSVSSVIAATVEGVVSTTLAVATSSVATALPSVLASESQAGDGSEPSVSLDLLSTDRLSVTVSPTLEGMLMSTEPTAVAVSSPTPDFPHDEL